jgi:hypothetical protein
MSDLPVLFLSYAQCDRSLAFELAAALETRGARVLADWAIRPGEDWIERTESMLAECDVFVPLVTPDFLVSQFSIYELGFVLRQAATGSTIILPVTLGDVSLSRLTGGLARFQALEGRGKPVSDIAMRLIAAAGERSHRLTGTRPEQRPFEAATPV